MKTTLSLCALAVILASLLCAGCAVQTAPAIPATPPADTASPPSATVTAPVPTPQEPTQIELPDAIETGTRVIFWHPFYGETANQLAELSEQFNQENSWGIEILIQPHGDERVIIQDMEEARLNDGLPDAAVLPLDYLYDLTQEGFSLQDFDLYVQSDRWGMTEEELASFFPVFWGAAVLEGRQVGLPAYWSGYYLFYNQSWAGELGFGERPLSTADFEAQACAAALQNLYDGDPNTSGTGGYVYSSEAAAIFSWMRAFGGASTAGASDSWRLAGEGDVAAGEFLYDLYLKDCAWTGRQTSPYQYFSNRLALFYSGRLEDVLIQTRVNEENGSLDQWTLIPYPPAVDRPVVLIEGSAYVILSSDPQTALAAWLWIQWLLEPQNQASLVQASGSFPLSLAALDDLGEFQLEHPAWSQALQYLALADVVPLDGHWQLAKDALADFAWQLIRFTTGREDIPLLLQNVESLLNE